MCRLFLRFTKISCRHFSFRQFNGIKKIINSVIEKNIQFYCKKYFRECIDRNKILSAKLFSKYFPKKCFIFPVKFYTTKKTTNGSIIYVINRTVIKTPIDISIYQLHNSNWYIIFPKSEKIIVYCLQKKPKNYFYCQKLNFIISYGKNKKLQNNCSKWILNIFLLQLRGKRISNIFCYNL